MTYFLYGCAEIAQDLYLKGHNLEVKTKPKRPNAQVMRAVNMALPGGAPGVKHVPMASE